MANIFPADFSDFFDLSLYNIIALTIEPHDILANVYKHVKNKDNVNVSNLCITFSYGKYTYVVYSDKKKINKFDVIKNSTGELFIRATFLPENNTMPFKIKVDYFYKNKSVIQKTYTFVFSSKVMKRVYQLKKMQNISKIL